MERRRLLLAGLASAAAVAVSVTPSAAITPVGPKPVAVNLVGASQATILRSKTVKAKVRARHRGRYRVTVAAIGSESSLGAQARPLTKPKTLRFKRPGTKRVKLTLTAAGASVVADCRPQQISLLAKSKKGRRARGRNVRDLTRDAGGCNQQGSTGGGPGGLSGDQPPGGSSAGPSLANAERCDWIDPAACMYPWPNDFFTRADPTTDTGRRLDLKTDSMPANRLGVHIAANDYNVADGFSPGNMVITKIPGFDNQEAFDRTGAVPITDMGRYGDPNQPVVVINADTGERQPIWAEIDANPPTDAERALIIRPARNFDEGARYIVALRDLKDKNGNAIPPGLGFQVYRDRLITPQAPIENRRPHMEELFQTLQANGIRRMNLTLAWDFTVASEKTLTGRALSIRDKAFDGLGDTNLSDMQVQGSSPVFNVTATRNFSQAENPKIAREVEGTVTVPCYLNSIGCGTGGQYLNLDSDDKPDQLPLNTSPANFRCEIPRSAIDGAPNPARISLYGHGLLGSASEVGGGNVQSMAAEHNVVECATDWIGFSTGDVPTVLTILQDVNNFPKLVDRTQQSFLNFMFLGRALIHPSGLSTNPAFQVGGQSVIDTQNLYYDGNSQGGILGGALTALAPDFNRAVLGVPAMNYSTLLERSTDFRPYAEGEFTEAVCDVTSLPPEACALLPDDTPFGLYDNYPDRLTRPLLFSIMQLLWDRGEPDGYAHHMTSDALADTPEHRVLLHPAFGDHQVANVAAEVEARTIGASAYKPALYPGRSPDAEPLFGIPAIPSFPFAGSAIVYYDGGPVGVPGGTTPPPTTDTPPVNGIPGNGADPHSYPRNDIKGRAQKSDFLMPNGMVTNYCTTQNNPLTDASMLTLGGTPTPCYAHGFLGP